MTHIRKSCLSSMLLVCRPHEASSLGCTAVGLSCAQPLLVCHAAAQVQRLKHLLPVQPGVIPNDPVLIKMQDSFFHMSTAYLCLCRRCKSCSPPGIQEDGKISLPYLMLRFSALSIAAQLASCKVRIWSLTGRILPLCILGVRWPMLMVLSPTWRGMTRSLQIALLRGRAQCWARACREWQQWVCSILKRLGSRRSVSAPQVVI